MSDPGTKPLPKAKGPPSPNYITRGGAKKLQDELMDLLRSARPKIVQEVSDAAAQGDRSENAEYIYGKKKLREIDRRILFLQRRPDAVTIVEPKAQRAPTGEMRVFFGAVVEVSDENDVRATYTIVGEDELDLARGHISWKSPLGRALLSKREGDTVTVKRPSGEVELEIVSVTYDAEA